MKKLFILFIILISTSSFAQLASDNASNAAYNDGWSGGDNGGSGFGTWDLWTAGDNGFAGHFIGSSSGDGFGDIDTDSKSFGMYGHGTNKQAHAQRGFNYGVGPYTVLQDGHTFSIELAVAFRNGFKGIDIYESDFTLAFNFNVAGDDYVFNGTSTGWSYSQTSIIKIEVTQEDANTIWVKATRGSDIVGPTSFSTTNRVGYFKCYVGNTDDGNSLNNLYFNNLEIRDSDPLPVELTSFTANVFDGKVKLSWETATEVDNYGFEVERQKLGDRSKESEARWNNIGFVEGHGNSNSPKVYSFVDDSPLSSVVKYRLKQIDIDGAYEYSDEIEVTLETIPAKFELAQNYPNPFNPSTVIKFNIPETNGMQNTHVKLEVFDVLGKRVAVIVNENLSSGSYEKTFNADGLSSGIYYYQLTTPEFSNVKKMILVR